MLHLRLNRAYRAIGLRYLSTFASDVEHAVALLDAALQTKKMPNALPTSFCTAFNQLNSEQRAEFIHRVSGKPTKDLSCTLPVLLSGGHGGLEVAMNMRDAIRAQQAASKDLDEVLKNWLSITFATDILQLQRITFESSSGYVLEQIGRGDAVHRIRTLAELKRRLSNGRRVFALFHPSLPQRVLAFVNIALVPEIATSMRYIDTSTAVSNAEDLARCAIFYSITSSIPSLSGIDLGTRLIKQASVELIRELPMLSIFSTLSPVPGFVSWLTSKASPDLLSLKDKQALLQLSKHVDPSCEEPFKLLQSLVSQTHTHAWQSCEICREVLKPVLLRLCAHYIVNEKAGGQTPLDPVTRFHVRAGAVAYQLNWWGNPSMRGLSESAGIMVNYLYDLDAVAKNNEAHLRDGSIPLGDSMRKLLTLENS